MVLSHIRPISIPFDNNDHRASSATRSTKVMSLFIISFHPPSKGESSLQTRKRFNGKVKYLVLLRITKLPTPQMKKSISFRVLWRTWMFFFSSSPLLFFLVCGEQKKHIANFSVLLLVSSVAPKHANSNSLWRKESSNKKHQQHHRSPFLSFIFRLMWKICFNFRGSPAEGH